MTSATKSLLCHLCVLVLVLCASPILAQMHPSKDSAELLPLPVGAVARLGDFRFDHRLALKSLVDLHEITALAASADGRLLVSALSGLDDEETTRVCLWEAETGKLLKTIPLPGSAPVTCLSVSPDKKTIAAGQRGVIHLLDVPTGKKQATLEGHDGWIRFVRFGKDGKTLLAADGMIGFGRKASTSLRLWDLATRKPRKVWQPPQPRPGAKCGEEREDCILVDVSANGRVLAWGCAVGLVGQTDMVHNAHLRVLHLVDMATGKEFRRIDKLDDVVLVTTGETLHSSGRLALSPDGKLVAVAGTGDLCIWQTKTGKALPAPDWRASSIVFTPDGKTLIGHESGQFRRWDVEAGKELGPIPARGALRLPEEVDHVPSVLFPQGDKLAVGIWGRLRVYSAQTRKELCAGAGHRSPVLQLAFSADGRSLLSADAERSARWDTKNWKQTDSKVFCDAGVYAPREQKSPLANWFIAGAFLSEGVLPFHTLDTNQPIHTLRLKGGGYRCQRLSADGKVAVLSKDNGDKERLRFWDVIGAKAISHVTIGSLLWLEFSRDGRRAVMIDYEDFSFRVVDVASGKALLTMPIRGVAQKSVYARATFASNDDHVLLALPAGEDTYEVLVVDVRTGRSIRVASYFDWPYQRPWRNRFRSEVCVASPDGRLLALLPTDAQHDGGDVTMWEVASGTKRGTIPHDESMANCLAFSPDSRHLACGSEDGTILVHDLHRPLGKRQVAKPLDPASLDTCWKLLAKKQADKADAAIWDLIALPEQTMPFLKKHLRAVPPSEYEGIRQSITDLSSDVFRVRQKATADLTKNINLAWPLLQEALKKPHSVEMQLRLQKLVDKGRQVVLTPDELRGVRAVEVLERIGNDQSRDLLQSLAKGATTARLTIEAKAALQRLDHAAH